MKSRISLGLCVLALVSVPAKADSLRVETLRNAARANGLVRPEQTHVAVSEDLAAVGKLIFETKSLSPSRSIACATCHIDRFGSADGLPQAIGVGGEGLGVRRLQSHGEIIPRNTLPFWGRGGRGFDVLFWDGKIDASAGRSVVSQFGSKAPTDDPLALAVHLPPAEFGEMAGAESELYQTETVDSATKLYDRVAHQLFEDEELTTQLAEALQKQRTELKFGDAAKAVAAFIRFNFQLGETRFHKFVFGQQSLTEQEVEGGLIFYGKGGCVLCHSGPYFSDFEFHAVPFPPLGFGKNGFGIDYGRYNVSQDPKDRGKFRTPPLFNVHKTAPYGHAGSIADLKSAISLHFDPLGVIPATELTKPQRLELYSNLKSWANEPIPEVVLLEDELDNLTAFLATLEYDAAWSVKSE